MYYYSKKDKKFTGCQLKRYPFWKAEFVHQSGRPIMQEYSNDKYFGKTELFRFCRHWHMNIKLECILPDAFFRCRHGYSGLYLKEKFQPECEENSFNSEEILQEAVSVMQKMQIVYDECKVRRQKCKRK